MNDNAMYDPVTAIHRLVERCRANQLPGRIARLRSGWAIMGDPQVMPGYCMLLPDPVVPHLNALDSPERRCFLDDMALLGDALLLATAGTRINYALFGNLEPALHAHLFPRRADEPEATRTLQPWALDWTTAPRYEPRLHDELRDRIATEVAHLSAAARG